ncbi:DEAD/DEAH box helicase [Desulfoluna sp.]|uniref:DEAD/DEAH box helicase n=1 Tax=Desulfoluna sp. TaxID=2045199 RepID=UPI0026283CC4|nr:DEAD/DEAH box helicase [Desulfoluna sp.]
MLFSQLGLSAELLRAIADQGYDQTTPIQEKAIPLVLEGRDVLAGAQTGTGKTAGFALPLLQRMQSASSNSNRPVVRALILVPTRELAAQVGESVSAYSRYLPYKTSIIFGGVSINPQISKLRKGVDIIVATPGRLLDHLQRGTVNLRNVETLVLDEADRMLDMGFIHDIRKVMKSLPVKRQTLLFSATFSRDIKKLSDTLLNSPSLVEVARHNTTAESVTQVVHPVDRTRKLELLSHMIGANNWRQVLVFTRTKHGANWVSQQLKRNGLVSDAIHGNKSQNARTRALADFKNGKVRVLVATDIAARGLDIEQLPHVVNYELPNVPEDYVHRIGRTGRAGLDGNAISLVCVDENKLLEDIQRMLKRKINKVLIPGYEPDPKILPEPILKRSNRRPSRNNRPAAGRASQGTRRTNGGGNGNGARNGGGNRNDSGNRNGGGRQRHAS